MNVTAGRSNFTGLENRARLSASATLQTIPSLPLALISADGQQSTICFLNWG
jgi:hypothetical protein